MSNNQLAFIFSAFTSDYADHPGRNITGFESVFHDFLLQAAASADPELANFNFTENTFHKDELLTQYLTYIYNCTVSLLLRKANVFPVMTAGYSMGIYAALYDSGSVSFETGLTLIRMAYQCMKASLKGKFFGMGTIIGLNEQDIRQLTNQSSLRVEIANQNATHSFVVSGYHDDIQILLALATSEGALHTRELGVTIPYHSGYLIDGSEDFSRMILQLKISTPVTPIISLLDQHLLTTPESLREEITRNLFNPLNWFRTMQAMQQHQISGFIECGPSKGLARNAKFVDGIKFFPLSSILP